MPHYVAIVEEAGPETAVGVWFPGLPRCFSACDDPGAARRNALEAITLYAQSLAEEGRARPPPRTLTELKRDPEIARDMAAHVVALVPAPARVDAAE